MLVVEVADSAEGDPVITTIEGNILTDPVPQKQPTSAQRVFPFPRGEKPQRNQWATGLNYESVAIEPPGYYPILCNPKKGGIAMKTKTMGAMIAQRRKGMGMTQLELANKMGVTDKAVSKWERNLSCPDIHSFPRLVEILHVSIEELMQSGTGAPVEKSMSEMVRVALKGIALAMGIAVVVLSVLGKLDAKIGMVLLGLGLVSRAMYSLRDKE